MLSESTAGSFTSPELHESTSMEESKAREKSLNGLSAWPTARFSLSLHVLPLLYLVSLSAPYSPFSCFLVLLSFRRIYPFPLSTRGASVVSLLAIRLSMDACEASHS